jgi:hypothetical protein
MEDEESLSSSHCHHNQSHWSVGSHYNGKLDTATGRATNRN